MKEYLTIKEACLFTSKSDKTIRRHIIEPREKLNKNSKLDNKRPVVIKQDSKYYILKSYLSSNYIINDFIKETSQSQTESIHLEQLNSSLISQINLLENIIQDQRNQIDQLIKQSNQWQKMMLNMQESQLVISNNIEPDDVEIIKPKKKKKKGKNKKKK